VAGIFVVVVVAVIVAASAMSQANAAKSAKDRAARAARAKAEADAKRQKQATEKMVSRQRAIYAAGGVTRAGTPLDVEDITLTQAEEERKQILMLGGYHAGMLGKEGAYEYGVGMGQAAQFAFSGAETLLGGIDSPAGQQYLND